MADLTQVIPVVLTGGFGAWAGNLIVQWVKSRGDRDTAQTSADVQIEQHRDELTLKLIAAVRGELTAAQGEVKAAREEASNLRRSEARLAHLEEALDHIEALLNSDGAEERKVAERRAKAFLNRMRRMAEAIGTIRNEEQLRESRDALPDEMRAALDTLDRKEGE